MRIRSKNSGYILDEICLRDLSIRCTIGIYPEEVARSQALQLNLALFLNTREAAYSGKLTQSVDYAALSREIQFILTQGRFRLLESAAEALASYILGPIPQDYPRAACEAVEVEIIKPEALRGISVPAVRIFREREEAVASDSSSARAMIFGSPETSLFRGVIPPQTSLRPWLPGWTVKAIMTGGAGLKVGGRELAAAEQLLGVDTSEYFLTNEGGEPRSFLAIAHRDPLARTHHASPASFSLLQSTYL